MMNSDHEYTEPVKDAARASILRHCAAIDDPHRPGILSKLRPYRGVDEHDYPELMTAILTIGKDFASPDSYDLVRHIWGLCWTIRNWAVRPTGLLRANKIISEQEVAVLDTWCEVIETTMLRLLGPHELHEAALPFLGLVAIGVKTIDSPVMRQILLRAASDDREELRETCAKAMSNCGIDRDFIAPLLGNLVRDPDRDVAQAASYALRNLG